jgi:hypothetical protein
MKPAARCGLIAAGVIAVSAAAAAGGLIYRLKQGPLELPGLAGPAAERLSDPVRGFRVGIDNMILTLADDLNDGRGRLEIHAIGVSIAGPDGRTLATVPEAALGLSATALLWGEVRPTRLELIRPKVTVMRRPDGGFGFNIGAAAETETVPASETEGDATPVAADLLGALTRSPDSGPLLGLLRSVAVRDGDLTLIDEGRGLRWRAAPATLILQRGQNGVDGRMRLRLDVDADGGGLPLEASLTYDVVSRTTRIGVGFADLRPAEVAGMAADLAPLRAFDLPLAGRVDATLNPDFRLETAHFTVQGAAGRVTLEKLPPLDLLGGEAAGRWEAPTRRLSFDKAALRLDGVTAEAAGAATLTADGLAEPQGRATLRFDNFVPSRPAAYAAELAPLAGLNFPLSGTATAELKDGKPSGAADLTLGAGTAKLDGVFIEPLTLKGGRLRAAADVGAGTYRLDGLELDLGGPRLTARADARTRDGRLTTELEAGLTDVAVAELDRLWPPAAGAKPRAWVLENLLAGTAPKITASAVLSAPSADLTDITPERISAQIIVENALLHYYRPLPPAVGIERTVADFDGKDFFIRTQGGTVTPPGLTEPVRATDGVIRIFNVGSPREDLTVDIGLTGPLRSILTVVDMPPLGYPSKLDIKPDKTAGHVDGRLKVGFPLFDSVKLDDVEVQVAAKATGAAIEKVVAGRNATEGELAVELDTHAMTVSGKARFDGAPITVNWREVFDSKIKGPGTVLEAQGRSDVKHLATFGPEFILDYAKGPVDAKVRYASGENHQATLNVNLDVAQTEMNVAPLNWRKLAGTAAQTRFVMHFKDGKPTRLTDIRFDGAGLQASAAAQLAAGGAQVSRIDAPRVKAGATDMALVATRGKDGGYLLKITGAAYDARGVLKDKDESDGKAAAGSAAPPPQPSPPMTVELQVGRLVFGEGRGLTDAEGRMKREDGEWNTVVIRGRTPPKGEFSLRLEPSRIGGGDLTIDADNAGAALRALDVTDRVRGGVLKATGRSPRRGVKAPIDGAISLTDYTLVDAPALARILNAMSVTGLVDLLSGEGIGFGSLTGDFRLHGDKLRFRNVRTSGGALGLTVEGDLDLGNETGRLNGTIVPVYGVNRIIGQIPLLGDLLSGGPGQGIFAATWSLQGKLADPDVSVNPLALLTPGFLRNLFFGGSGGSDAPTAPTPQPENRQ